MYALIRVRNGILDLLRFLGVWGVKYPFQWMLFLWFSLLSLYFSITFCFLLYNKLYITVFHIHIEMWLIYTYTNHLSQQFFCTPLSLGIFWGIVILMITSTVLSRHLFHLLVCYSTRNKLISQQSLQPPNMTAEDCNSQQSPHLSQSRLFGLFPPVLTLVLIKVHKFMDSSFFASLWSIGSVSQFMPSLSSCSWHSGFDLVLEIFGKVSCLAFNISVLPSFWSLCVFELPLTLCWPACSNKTPFTFTSAACRLTRSVLCR